MTIESLFNELIQLSPFLNENVCIVNRQPRSLEELEKASLRDFVASCHVMLPSKLYKYFPNRWIVDQNVPRNYSLEALIKNTVFLQHPSKFDDIFDSRMHVDRDLYKSSLIRYLCNFFLKASYKEYSTNKDALIEYLKNYDENLLEIGNEIEIDDSIEILDQQYLLNFFYSIEYFIRNGLSCDDALEKFLEEKYNQKNSELQDILGVSCFTTSPFMNNMWSNSYANCHEGFCIEYSVEYSDDLRDMWEHTYPMIYCNHRPDNTLKIVAKEHQRIDEEYLKCVLTHGVLRKSIEWVLQDEWRLCLPLNMYGQVVKFFPISKVFIGPRMNKQNRYELINICKQRKIDAFDIRYRNDSFRLEAIPIESDSE